MEHRVTIHTCLGIPTDILGVGPLDWGIIYSTPAGDELFECEEPDEHFSLIVLWDKEEGGVKAFKSYHRDLKIEVEELKPSDESWVTGEKLLARTILRRQAVEERRAHIWHNQRSIVV